MNIFFLIFPFFTVAPEINKLFPPNLNLTAHDTLKLSCEAGGFPLPSITWTREGKRAAKSKNGKNRKKHIREEHTKRARKSIYEKQNVGENDAGVYVCTAKNGNHPVARKSLRVNVFCKKIFQFLFDLIIQLVIQLPFHL